MIDDVRNNYNFVFMAHLNDIKDHNFKFYKMHDVFECMLEFVGPHKINRLHCSVVNNYSLYHYVIKSKCRRYDSRDWDDIKQICRFDKNDIILTTPLRDISNLYMQCADIFASINKEFYLYGNYIFTYYVLMWYKLIPQRYIIIADNGKDYISTYLIATKEDAVELRLRSNEFHIILDANTI